MWGSDMSIGRPLIVALWIAGTLTAGASGAAKKGKAKDQGLGLWNVNVMVEQAAKQIIRRYKLTDEQAGYTRQLMAKRVNTLLDKHEDRIRQLFREAIAMRTTGKPPSAEAIKSWSERAMPIYEDAKREIIAGNEEWGQILSPEQQKIHKLDLKMMKVDFNQYEERLGRWSKGGFDAKKDWVTKRPPARRTTAKPRGVKKPKPKVATPNPQVAQRPPGPAGPPKLGVQAAKEPGSVQGGADDVELDPEHFWDIYVRDFSRKYRLDSGQRGQARAVLKDCKERARRHRDAHREEYERLHGRIRQLRGSGADVEARGAANAELADLDAPISDLFEELKSRLEGIPTTAQLQKYQQGRERPAPKR